MLLIQWSLFINNAHALTTRQIVSKAIIERVKLFSKGIDPKEAKRITKVLKQMLQEFKESPALKALLKSGSAIRYFASLATIAGTGKIRPFFKKSREWRVNRWFVLFAINYIALEETEGRLQLGDKRKLMNLIGDIFSPSVNKQQGALFQLSQVAYYHIKNQLDASQPKVLGMEQVRPAFFLVKGDVPPNVKAYQRTIDIIVDGPDGGETWVEIKSLAKSNFTASKFKNKLVKSSYYRQFFHDMRLNDAFINQTSKAQILDPGEGWVGNDQYKWYFHKFSATKGIPPTRTEEEKARGWLCAKADINNRRDYYKYNLSGDTSAMQLACERKHADITLRDTQSYITELMQPLVIKLGNADYFDMIKSWD